MAVDFGRPVAIEVHRVPRHVLHDSVKREVWIACVMNERHTVYLGAGLFSCTEEAETPDEAVKKLQERWPGLPVKKKI